jgi:hypothetical protein
VLIDLRAGLVEKRCQPVPCVRKKKGELVAAISAFSEAAVAADANAFGRLMPQLRQIDARKQTLLMAQVENETRLFCVAMRAQD